ncbi:hypothetical protein Tco_0884088 [Tanacetum coccineum]
MQSTDAHTYIDEQEQMKSTDVHKYRDEREQIQADADQAKLSGNRARHLDALNLILTDLKNAEVKIEDEDAALVLLVSLPPFFECFVSSYVVGKDTITLEDVRSSFHSKELRQQASGSGYGS